MTASTYDVDVDWTATKSGQKKKSNTSLKITAGANLFLKSEFHIQ